MVAPTYQKYKKIGDPFAKGEKMYIKLQHPTTGNIREARWYSELEYAKQYGKTEEIDTTGSDKMKEIRGFAAGPILVIRNVKPADEEWLKASVARFAVGIGWHIISTAQFPSDAPAHFKYVLLGWNEAKLDERHLKEPEVLAKIISDKMRKGEYVKMEEAV